MSRWAAAAAFAALAAFACGRSEPATPAPQPLAAELVLYDWEDDLPQSVLDAFASEFGVRVKYLTYESQEEAIGGLRAGRVYDVVVLESRHLPALVREGLLAEIDYRNVPNHKNVSPGFRDLVSDPGNRHNVPFNWGLTGLVVRTDLVAKPVTSWADLWNPLYRGKVALWMRQEREVIALTLKSLGHSANSENPQELEAALERLLQLNPHTLTLEDFDPASSAEAMAGGQVALSMGYANDVLEGRRKNPNIAFVLPREGALMWGDTFVIPAKSPSKRTAETFLNFLLRPEVAAEITNENLFAIPNEPALRLVEPGLRSDPVVFPPQEGLRNAETILPLSPEGEKLYASVWRRLLEARR